MDQCPGDHRSSEGIWEKLSQIAVKGAAYDSRERQPHPKCLEGTRTVLLNHIHGFLDNRGHDSRLIWLHGTAGVGKSAVAFTVAERMRGLPVTGWATKEKRLAGSFFFSRTHTKRCTTEYFFATLVYQLARNFPSIREDVIRAIREDPAVLDPDTSLHDQMETLFLRPLQKLRFRLRDSAPLAFIVDALDECTSKTELADLISLLGQALREPDLPAVQILLTSRSEPHICEAMREEKVCPLICEIPVKTSGEGVTPIISLDGADVDHDIYIFLEHSFTKLQGCVPNFPRPTPEELARLASRAGRRFIVASTMVKFIDDGYNNPRNRLQLMLDLTSELLPGTEVYELYNRILLTCADPKRAYLHLSVVAALADPLSISQISELLGPGEGKDVETVLMQLRSVIDIPADTNLPVHIYHSSLRDYVSNPSNCSLPQVHSLLAHSSLQLMMQEIPESLALLSALSDLKKKQGQAMEPDDPHRLKCSLAFIVQPPEPMQVLMGLVWLRGDRSSVLSWLGTLDGHAWLLTQGGKDWLQTKEGKAWLQTGGGKGWLVTERGRSWQQTMTEDLTKQEKTRQMRGPQHVRRQLKTTYHGGWFHTLGERRWLQTSAGQTWLQTWDGLTWLQTRSGRNWAQTSDGRVWLCTPGGRDWLRTPNGREWLQTSIGREWLETRNGPVQLGVQSGWLWTRDGQDWLRTRNGREWLLTESGQDYLETQRGRDWLETWRGREWLHNWTGRTWLVTQGGREWLQTESGREWLQTQSGQDWLQTWRGRDWLQTHGGREWLQIRSGRDWLQTRSGRGWLQIQSGQEWLQTWGGREWLQNSGGQDWLQTQSGQDWLHIPGGREWLQTKSGKDWLQNTGGQEWLQTSRGRDWLQTPGGLEWVQTQNGQDWLQTQSGQEWLQIESGREWLQTPGGVEWLQTQNGKDWLLTQSGLDWLQIESGKAWLQTQSGRAWLQTRSGREWLQTPDGQTWQSTPAASVLVTMEEFSGTLEALSEYIIIPELPLLPAFQAIQQFKSLPDFLMFPAALALRQLYCHEILLYYANLLHQTWTFFVQCSTS